MPVVVTLVQAAEVLGLSPDTLRWQIRRGKIRATKVGPIWTLTQKEVDRYGRENRGNHDPRTASKRRR